MSRPLFPPRSTVRSELTSNDGRWTTGRPSLSTRPAFQRHAPSSYALPRLPPIRTAKAPGAAGGRCSRPTTPGRGLARDLPPSSRLTSCVLVAPNPGQTRFVRGASVAQDVGTHPHALCGRRCCKGSRRSSDVSCSLPNVRGKAVSGVSMYLGAAACHVCAAPCAIPCVTRDWERGNGKDQPPEMQC